MSTKLIFPCTLILAVLGMRALHAQDYRAQPSDLGPPPGMRLDATKVPAPGPAEAVPPLQGASPGLSHWITYQRPECCGSVGCQGPIGSEIYLLTGVEIPAAGKFFGHTLETGWVIQGGGRTLFFNPAMDRDWNIDLSISNILNRGQHRDIRAPLNLAGAAAPVLVSVRELNRTAVNAALGREWYLHRPPEAWIHTWRIGVSAGGRLGTEKLETFETGHRTDIFGGMFCAMSSDVEIPYGCCTFLAGMRAEWGHSWADILQHQNVSDIEDVNILFTFGVRY